MIINLETSYAQLVNQLVDAHGIDGTIRSLALMSGYERIPPTIEEFISSSDYLGNELGDSLYPTWKKVLNQIYPSPLYSPYLEVILSGSIGSGKSTVAVVGILYDILKLLCIKNPQKHYKILESSKIVFTLLNITMNLSESVCYDKLIGMMQGSPYFRNLLDGRTGKQTLLPKNIDVAAYSKSIMALGQDIFGGILSELNFHSSTERAYEKYNTVKTRMQSRFLRTNNNFPGHLWLDSSKSDNLAFLDDHIKNISDDPTALICSYSIWEVKKHILDFSGKTFKCFIGSDKKDPLIIESPSQTINLDDASIIDIPIEFKNNFERDLSRSLQDLAGVGTYGFSKFFSSLKVIDEALIRKNPVSMDIIPLDFFDQNQLLIEYVYLDVLKKSKTPAYIHIDLGITGDKCGMASTRIDCFINIIRCDTLTGKKYKIRVPIFITDFVLCVESMSEHGIPIYKIENFMVDLKACGYKIAVISTDGFQSTNLRQNLTLKGFNTKLISTDRTRQPYDNFRNAVFEGRWNGVKHPILEREIKNLIDYKDKIDHLPKESKDIADGVAGSIHSAQIDLASNERSESEIDEFLKLAEQKVSKNASIYNKIHKHTGMIVQ